MHPLLLNWINFVEIYSRNALINVFCFFLSTTPLFQYLTACWSSMHAKTTQIQRAMWLTNDMMRLIRASVQRFDLLMSSMSALWSAMMTTVQRSNACDAQRRNFSASAAAAAAAASRTRLAVACPSIGVLSHHRYGVVQSCVFYLNSGLQINRTCYKPVNLSDCTVVHKTNKHFYVCL